MRKLFVALGVVMAVQSGLVLAQTNVGVEGMVGRRWAELDMDGVQAAEFASNVFYKLKDLPIALGARFALVNFMNADLENSLITDVSEAYGFDADLAVKLMMPKSVLDLDKFLPYAKFSQTVFSNYEYKGKGQGIEVKGSGESTGNQVALGSHWQFQSNLSFMGEFSFGNQKLRQKYKGKDQLGGFTTTKKYSYDSKALLLGANLLL